MSFFKEGEIVFCIDIKDLEAVRLGDFFEIMRNDPEIGKSLMDRGFRENLHPRYWELCPRRFVLYNKENWCKYFDKFMRLQNDHLPQVRTYYF